MVAPGQSQELLNLIVEPDRTTKCNEESEYLLELLTKIYNESTSNVVKDHTLSLMAGLSTKENLKNRIPGLTKYHIDKVRAVSPDQIFQRLMSYSTRELELDSGETIVIPDVLRTACHSSIIDMYEKHCEDTDFSPLSRASLFQILHACSASKRRNLYGLDNITADGLAAFKSLSNIIKNLENKGIINKDTKATLTKLLSESQNYLKRTFKFHVLLNSSCADHCIMWPCSDSKDAKFQSVCNHDHVDSCQQCENLSMVSDQVCSLDLDDDEAIDVTEARNNIQAWKAHIVRTINQDRGRVDLLDSMQTCHVLLVMDWAMKFLPLLHRERQSDWFGQKGISWHVTVCITKDDKGSLKHSTWVHIFESGKQDWFAVASILEHTLSSVVQQYPCVKEAFLRSDNAGCYHNGFLWSSIPSISERTGIQIKSYNFSEAQSGKSYCDAKIAHLRKKMRMHVADGNDIKFPVDMKMALDSGGGVTGCQVAVVAVDYSHQQIISHKWKDVRFITDLEVESCKMTTHHAYDIGNGNVIEASSMVSSQQNSTGLKILSEFRKPEKQEGHIQNPTIIKEPLQCFPCSEEGYVQSFYTFEEYEEHMYFEKHTYEFHQNSDLSTFDRVKLRWAEKCNLVSQSEEQISMPIAMCDSDKSQQGTATKGWALQKEKKQVRFKQHVRDFLKEVFKTGEESGKKANPLEVALHMKQ
ncbi:uncharacterized protein LOC133192865 [Saccostrea echinata]|uniref:uncharacterized protein LOC133192865 n=1 Tax=Saccostrea echinata TaxID=191078 RepID=UPI002A7EE450|nr:uncharacterized protein LOC133192865 [Saccostrea echinata]